MSDTSNWTKGRSRQRLKVPLSLVGNKLALQKPTRKECDGDNTEEVKEEW